MRPAPTTTRPSAGPGQEREDRPHQRLLDVEAQLAVVQPALEAEAQRIQHGRRDREVREEELRGRGGELAAPELARVPVRGPLDLGMEAVESGARVPPVPPQVDLDVPEGPAADPAGRIGADAVVPSGDEQQVAQSARAVGDDLSRRVVVDAQEHRVALEHDPADVLPSHVLLHREHGEPRAAGRLEEALADHPGLGPRAGEQHPRAVLLLEGVAVDEDEAGLEVERSQVEREVRRDDPSDAAQADDLERAHPVHGPGPPSSTTLTRSSQASGTSSLRSA